MKKEFKTLRGVISYWTSDPFTPDRDTIVFLHGLTGDHSMFEKQIEYFSHKFNIIAWDAPAHGQSRPYSNFTYENAASDLKHILQENQVPFAIMVGQSLGGYIIQSFLQRYPQMVKAFIGIDTTPYGEKYYSKSDQWWLRQIEWMSYLFPLKSLKKAIAKGNTFTPAGYDNMLSMLAPYRKKELCHLMGVGYAGFLADNKDMEIQCPVLLLLGEQDRTGKVPQYNRAWADQTGYPLVMIKNAAHNSNVDNPQDTNREIERFIQSIQS